MAELGSLVVELALKSTSFQEGIRSANRQIRESRAEFRNAGAGVEGYGKTLNGLKSKADMLTKQIQAQNKIVEANRSRYEDSKKTLDDNVKSQEKLKREMEEVERRIKSSTVANGENSERTKKLKESHEELGKEYETNEEKIRNNVRSIENWNTKTQNSEARLKGMQAELKNTNKEIEVQSSKWTELSNKAEEFANKAENIGGKLSSMGSTMTKAITLPMMAIGGLSAKAAIDFESSMADIFKTIDGTPEQLKNIEEGIISMSGQLPSTTAEIAEVAGAAGQLGIQTDNILGFSKVMIDLANSTNIVGEEGAAQLAKFANITQMSQEDFDKLGSTIVDLGNNLATTEKDIVNMGMRLAGAGAQIGMTEAQIMAMAGALSSVGIEAEAGGSAFSKIMIQMATSVETGLDGFQRFEKLVNGSGYSMDEASHAIEKGGKELDKLAKKVGTSSKGLRDHYKETIKAKGSLDDFSTVAGMTSEQFVKLFKEDSSKAIIAFIEGLGDAEKQGKSTIQILEDMGIKEVRLRDALLRAANASNVFTDAMEIGNGAWEENTALLDEASQRYETTESQMAMAKNQITEARREIGQNMLPVIRNLAVGLSKVTGWIAQLNPKIHQMFLTVGGFLALGGPLLSIGGKLVGGIGKTAQGFSNLSKDIAKASIESGLATKGIRGTAEVMKHSEGTTKALGTVIKGVFSPTGAVLGVAIAGLAIFAKKMHDNKKAMEEAQEERTEFVKGYADLVKKNKNSIEVMEELEDEYNILNSLVGENGDLSAMNADQKERYLKIVKQLVDSGAEINTFYNEEGELVADNTAKMSELIKAKKEEMALDARKMKLETKKALQEESKELQKQIDLMEEKKKKRDRLQEIVDAGGVTQDGRFTPLPDSVLKNHEKNLNKLNQELEEHENKLESVKIKMIELRDAGLQGIDAELENISPNVDELKKSFTELMETDATGEKTSKAIEGLDRIFKELDESVKITKDDIKGYAKELNELGLESSYVSDEMIRLATENELGAEKFALVNKALDEYNTTGKLSAETSKEFAKEFGEIPGTLEEFSVDTLKQLEKNGDGWLSTFLATNLEMTKGAVEKYNSEVKELDLNLEAEILSPEQYNESLSKLEGHRKDFINKLNKEKEDNIEAVRYLYQDAQVISEEEANARIEDIEKHYSKQIQSVQQGFISVEKELKEKVNELKPELDNALVDVLSGAKELDKVWNGLSFEAKEFIAEQVGLDDVSEMTESLLKKWLEDPGTLEFIVKNLGIDDTIDSLDGLQKYWDSLDTEEKGKIFNEKLAKGIESNKGQPIDVATQTGKEAVDAVDKEVVKGKQSGEQLGEHFIQGLEGKKPQATTKGKEVGKATAKTLEEAKAEAKGAGGDVVSGFASGLTVTQHLLQSARNVAGAALSQMRSVLDTHSPSKETEKYGKWTSQGLGIGMVKGIPDVEKRAKELAQSTLKTMETELKQAELTVPKNILRSQTSSALSGKNKNYSSFVSKLKADELEETKKMLEADYKARERALNKQIRNLDKKKNKNRIDQIKKNKEALRERNEDVKQILDDRLDIVNEKMAKESNIFTDRMNSYDASIKRLSRSSDDLTVELTNNNAIYMLQAQRVKELEAQHKKMTKEFGSSSTEAVKLKKALEEAKLAYEDYGDAIKDTEEKIRQSKVDLVNDTTERIKNALRDRYQEEQRLAEESLQKDLENLSKWESASRESISSVYDEKIKRIKESSQQAIKALQDEIDSINKLQQKEDREDINRKELKEIASLEEALLYEHDEYNKLEIQKKIESLRKSREDRLRKQELEDKKQALQDEVKDIQENSNKQIEMYQDRKEAELENIRLVAEYERENLNQRLEDNRQFYENKLNDANLQAEAERMVIDNNQKEIIRLLKAYEKDYEAVGQSLGDKFVQGFNKEIEGIRETIEDLNKQIDRARNQSVLGMYLESNKDKNGTVSSTVDNSKVNTVNIYSSKKLDHYEVQRETESTLRRLALGGV